MDNKKSKMGGDNFNQWLRSLGYLFPSNELELARFEVMYRNHNFKISVDDLSIERILNYDEDKTIKTNRTSTALENENINEWRLAARNKNDIDPDILEKMRKNQSGSSEQEDQ
ncbi:MULTISPECIES: hypothetical protein [unclassified Lewinella]|uniref:hypothetical protein n=1 Tax=unclassified Lewinella TaxID=2637037 RepID=UPI000E237AB2|nr:MULTISPECIES: hypothetical protein [unclassified Lewinella]